MGNLLGKCGAALLVTSMFAIQFIILPWQVLGLILMLFGVDIWTPLEGVTQIMRG